MGRAAEMAFTRDNFLSFRTMEGRGLHSSTFQLNVSRF